MGAGNRLRSPPILTKIAFLRVAPILRGTFIPIHAVNRDKCTPQDSKVVAWSLLGFGYAKDIALLQGVSSFVTDGTADKILDKLLRDVATKP